LEISTELKIILPEGDVTIGKMEEEVLKAVLKAGRDLLVLALQTKEEELLKKGKAVRQTRKSRYILSRLGRFSFSRYKVRFKDGRMGYLLDEAVGLTKHKEATPLVRKLTSILTAKGNLSYRETSKILSLLIGEKIDHRVLWGYLQADGRKIRKTFKEKKTAMFEKGIYPKTGEVKDIVVVEADGTFVRSNNTAGDRIEAKTAILYTGKELVSEKAKHKRYRLKEKVTLSTTEGSEELAKWAVSVGEEKLSLSKAKNVLVIADGSDWCQNFLADWFPGAIYQLDHYHLKRRIRDVCRGDQKLYQALEKLALSNKVEHLIFVLKVGKLTGRIEEEKAEDLANYLEANKDGIWGSKKLLGQAPKEVLVVGSGAVEKTQDIFISRRMKRRGMHWSREGAENLLALRSLSQDNKAWNRFWKEAA
jgi:hypothetical protein